MKGMAAARIHDYERAVEALADYATTVELGFRIVRRHHPRAVEEITELEGPVGLVVVGTDQGMVGRFNEAIVAHARRELRDAGMEPPMRVLALGARVTSVLIDASLPPDETVELPGSMEAVGRRVMEVLLAVDRWREEGHVTRLLVAHHRPAGQASYEPSTRTLLPVDPRWLADLERSWPSRCIPTYRLSTAALIQALVRQYLLMNLQRALAESLASENAHRLASMQAAERNVEERLDALRGRYHRRRQSEITAELLEVTAGFDVIGST